MTFVLKSKTPNLIIEEEITGVSGEYSSINDLFTAELFDYVSDQLWNFYSDILSDCPVLLRGSFIEEDVFNYVHGYAEETINSNRSNWIIECSEVDSQGAIVNTFLLSLSDVLLDMLESDSSSGEFAARLGSYVEDCLLAFVKNGSWHIEKDRLWFGSDGDIAHAWVINSETTPEELSFWFEDESWSVMEHIGNFSDGFLVWYTAECGFWVPDMNSIREACPISFDEHTTVRQILTKASEWCSENR